MAKDAEERNHLVAQFGIFVLALSVAVGTQAIFPKTALAQQGARGAAPAAVADQGLTDPALIGALDTHAHMAPDSPEPQVRGIDVIEYAQMAKARGMRGFVIKQQYDQTAQLAYIARKMVPGLEVFGGIVMSRTVGGMSAEAVQHMAKVTGGWGRIVWMSTFDAENQVRYSKENRPSVPVSRGGAFLPEVKEVMSPPLFDLFLSMRGIAQRHGYDVYRMLRSQGWTDPDLLAAALLHDVGKGRLSVASRALWVLLGAWSKGLRERLALHPVLGRWLGLRVNLYHAALGAELVHQAQGSLITAWLIANHELQGHADPVLQALQRADSDS